MWPLRLFLARLRPFDGSTVARLAVVGAVLGAFLYGDYRLFARLFMAVARVEESTPFFAIGLLHNLLAMVFLIAMVVLFSSALTAAIGAFFVDHDLEIYHAAPIRVWKIALARWTKTLLESAAVVFTFILPLFIAFGVQYKVADARFFAEATLELALILTIPVSLAGCVILLLVRFFPVRRVHQIVATIAIITLTTAVTAFRMSRPERFFANITTDDVTRVLQAIALPGVDRYPSTALADLMTSRAGEETSQLHALLSLFTASRTAPSTALPSSTWRLLATALVSFGCFMVVAVRTYLHAFVRARESMAPPAVGGRFATGIIDRLLTPFDIQTRALFAKEIRLLVRDVAQWSQVFMMGALLFIYLYNVHILPLSGDVRATIIAYANLGMAGFVIAAICLRFAFPSVSAEGKAFWLIEGAPISYRRFLLVKVATYTIPLTIVALSLTAAANFILEAKAVVWAFTLTGSSLLAITLVSLGVGLGAIRPNFGVENPLQVGLSLGGFAYMAVALAYVATMMLLMARPVTGYVLFRVFGIAGRDSPLAVAFPILTAILVSLALVVLPLLAAERRLALRR